MTTLIALHIAFVTCVLTAAAIVVELVRLRRDVRASLPRGPRVAGFVIPERRQHRPLVLSRDRRR